MPNDVNLDVRSTLSTHLVRPESLGSTSRQTKIDSVQTSLQLTLYWLNQLGLAKLSLETVSTLFSLPLEHDLDISRFSSFPSVRLLLFF